MLANPATNVRLGIWYLGDAWFLARGDLCTVLMKYHAGHGENAMSRRGVDCCARVRAYLASAGFALALDQPPLPAPTVRARAAPRAAEGSGQRAVLGGVARKAIGPRAIRHGRRVAGG